MRYSVVYFSRHMLSGPPAAPFYGRYNYGPVHRHWDAILRMPRFVLAAARGAGKSTTISTAFAIHCMYWNIRSSFLLINSTDKMTVEALRFIRDEIESNKRLQWLIPANASLKPWHSHDMQATNGFKLQGRSFFGKKRGHHNGTTLCDDVLADDAKFSADYRRKAEDQFLSVISNIPLAGGHLGVSGTTFHPDDLICKTLADNPDYHAEKFPALNEDGSSIWPELMPVAFIERRRRELGTIRFNTEMMCNPVSDEMSILPASLMMAAPQEQRMFCLGTKKEDLPGMRFFMGVDLAISAESGADYFVAQVWGVDGEQNRWIVQIERHRGIGLQPQLSICNTLARLYDVDLCYIESNQFQRIVSDELIRTTDLPVRPFNTTGEKHHLEHGIPALRLLAENRKFRIPRGDERSCELTSELLAECSACTLQKGRVTSGGGHDDLLMSAYFTNRAIRDGMRLGMVLAGEVSEGEQDDEPELEPMGDYAGVNEVMARINMLR